LKKSRSLGRSGDKEEHDGLGKQKVLWSKHGAHLFDEERMER
jgi:hypothetical protein